MAAYYNENDKFCAQWLRNLIAAGRIAPGEVDERSIEDVRPDDLKGFTQVHMFAGIGVWSYALRRAGWDDSRPAWTGSCPCQPFSAAGEGAGFADERHLWPDWHHLISECRPPVVFGEQVASRDGLSWLDLVQSDLEGSGYACGPVDLCAAGVGAPHIRQRLWFVAHSDIEQRNGGGDIRQGWRFESANGGIAGNPMRLRESGAGEWSRISKQRVPDPQPISKSAPMFWGNADWIWCKDGKKRPVEPGTSPLAASSAGRVGRVHAYGNTINAEAAKEFIAAYLESGISLPSMKAK